MHTFFTVLRYLIIKKKPELRLNGMVTPVIMDFRTFSFLLIWYDRAWQFISKKYNFILWSSFFFQTFDFKNSKIETTSHKIYWDNHFLQNPFDQWWWVCKLHRDYAADKLLTYNNDIGEGEGVLMELSLSFLRENSNKLCFIELSKNFCDWL